MYSVVPDLCFGSAYQEHVAEDTSVIYHILILEPGSVAELVDLYHQVILALLEIRGNIEAVGTE